MSCNQVYPLPGKDEYIIDYQEYCEKRATEEHLRKCEQIFVGVKMNIEDAYLAEKWKIPMATRLNMLKYSLFGRYIHNDILWITINPMDDGDFATFAEKVHDLCRNTSYIKNADYAFEQRGKEIAERGKGYHVHIVCDYIKGCNPGKVRDNIYQKFKKFVGNKLHIDVRKYGADLREDKIAYLSGDKWEADKASAVEVNFLWRKENNIDTIYHAEGKTNSASRKATTLQTAGPEGTVQSE